MYLSNNLLAFIILHPFSVHIITFFFVYLLFFAIKHVWYILEGELSHKHINFVYTGHCQRMISHSKICLLLRTESRFASACGSSRIIHPENPHSSRLCTASLTQFLGLIVNWQTENLSYLYSEFQSIEIFLYSPIK